MKLPQVTVRDLCWAIIVVACLCAWYRETWRVQEAAREAEQIASQRNFWIQKASAVQDLAAKNDFRVRYFQTGVEFQWIPPERRLLPSVAWEEMPGPESVTGPEVLPVVP